MFCHHPTSKSLVSHCCGTSIVLAFGGSSCKMPIEHSFSGIREQDASEATPSLANMTPPIRLQQCQSSSWHKCILKGNSLGHSGCIMGVHKKYLSCFIRVTPRKGGNSNFGPVSVHQGFRLTKSTKLTKAHAVPREWQGQGGLPGVNILHASELEVITWHTQCSDGQF